MDDVVDVFEDEQAKPYLSYREIKKKRAEISEDTVHHSTDKLRTQRRAPAPAIAVGRVGSPNC